MHDRLTFVTLKFIQVNIYKGKYFDNLVEFLNSEQPDIVSMQEVSSGSANLGGGEADLFEQLKTKTGMRGFFNADFTFSDSVGHSGNAILTKHKIVESKIVVLSEHDIIPKALEESRHFAESGPRHLVDCEISLGDGVSMHGLCIHGAWTAPPTDTPTTLRQAKMIADHLQSLNKPFLLGGDFNAIITSKTIGLINEVANNLLLNTGIIQTTHPSVHKIAPRGYLIDFIFASLDIKVISVQSPTVLVSDHLPVIATVDI